MVEQATEAQDVALLASDLDGNGGKLILTAGAPKVTGDDEERMLLAVRRILDAELPMPGAHRHQPRRRCSPATSAPPTGARTR